MRNEMFGRKCSRGFTLIEIMAVVVIIGLLLGFGIRVGVQQVAKAKIVTAKGHIKQIEGGVQQFYMDNSRYPGKLADLMTEPTYASAWQKGGYLTVLPKDPWHNNYFYEIPGPDGKPYVVGSYGTDGKSGGEDDDADITCWNIYDEQDEK